MCFFFVGILSLVRSISRVKTRKYASWGYFEGHVVTRKSGKGYFEDTFRVIFSILKMVRGISRVYFLIPFIQLFTFT